MAGCGMAARAVAAADGGVVVGVMNANVVAAMMEVAAEVVAVVVVENNTFLWDVVNDLSDHVVVDVVLARCWSCCHYLRFEYCTTILTPWFSVPDCKNSLSLLFFVILVYVLY